MAPPADTHPDLARLYRAAIRQHAADPVGFRQPIDATHRHEEYNPLCGDRIEIRLRISREQVEAAAFEGEACAICLASASLLCSLAPGRPVAALRQLSAALSEALTRSADADSARDSGPGAGPDAGLHPALKPLLGVRSYPSRIRCATLPWTAAVRALGG